MQDETRKMIDSRIYGVSARGWLAFMILFTMCLLSGFSIEIKEPLNSATLIAMGFYFGQKNG